VLREAEQEQKNLADAVATLSSQFEQSKPQQLQSAYESLKKEAEELGVSLEGIGEGYSD
jgi:chromosome segregation and condensation protein ScpB